MKSLIVSASFPLSREEVSISFIYDEAVKLAEKGVEIHVSRMASGRDALRNGMHVHNVLNLSLLNHFVSGVKQAFWFPLSLPLRHKIGLSMYSKSIASVVEKNSIDIIHAQWAYPEGLGALLAKEAVDKPLVVTLHGFDIITEASIGYGIRLFEHYDSAVRKVLQGADKVLVASRCVYEEALKAGCPEDALVLVPNGVDLERFNPNIDGFYVRDKLGLKDCPVVFCIRHHVPKNGIEYLIRAIPFVVEKVSDASFVVGGTGPLLQNHKLLANELGVSKNVVFAGRIPQDELPYYYAACNVSAIPSVIEAFGLATVEAMACGKPVVGSNVCGIPDVISDGENGFLVEPRDQRSLAEKILVLIKDEELAKKMGRKGRQIAEEKFDLEKRIDKITELYSELNVCS